MSTRFSASEVVDLLDLLAQDGVEVWIDGGWGIDALLGRQTREHSDLDVVIDDQWEAATRRTLDGAGFVEIQMWFTTAVHTVWQHEDGRAVDLHVVTFNDEGDGVYGDEGVYPAQGFSGRGVIGAREVRCISAEVQMEFHRGYEMREQDRHDIALLHSELGVELPPEHRQ